MEAVLPVFFSSKEIEEEGGEEGEEEEEEEKGKGEVGETRREGRD